MIRTLTASTENIDDFEEAVEDLKKQLDWDHNLLKNTVGIINCHYEFAESGTLKAISGALPFPTLGIISSAQGTGGGAGTLLFSIMVITSDTVSFKTAMTSSIKEKAGSVIEETYKNAAAGNKPDLIFTFAPFLVENSGDDFVNSLTKASDGAPCFGTLAVDDTVDFHECFLLYNGEHYQDRMAMLLFYGEINPRFYLATISEDKIVGRSAHISSSEGHILKEVNGRPVVEFFEELGLTKASETSYAMTSLPFMLDYNDGTPPVSKVFISLNKNKHAICAGVMPEGATLRIGIFDKDDVLLTTGKALDDVLAETENASGILIYSCVSRALTLGNDFLAETELVREKLGGKYNFLMACSGGEICPTRIDADTAINRFHNNTFILCVF